MNRSQLAEAIAAELNLPRTTVKSVLHAYQSAVASSLQNGEKVTISNFGTFSITHTAARVGRNPRTGETVRIDPKIGIKFRHSFDL